MSYPDELDGTRCPNCGLPKGDAYELCKACSDEAREASAGIVTVHHVGCTGETEMAMAFKLRRGFCGPVVWVPKSVLENRGDDWFTVPRWFAEREEFDYEE